MELVLSFEDPASADEILTAMAKSSGWEENNGKDREEHNVEKVLEYMYGQARSWKIREARRSVRDTEMQKVREKEEVAETQAVTNLDDSWKKAGPSIQARSTTT